jgi:hypothetical protein
MQHRIENRVEEKGKGADHDHDFEGHDKKNDDAASSRNALEVLQKVSVSHEFSSSKIVFKTTSKLNTGFWPIHRLTHSPIHRFTDFQSLSFIVRPDVPVWSKPE